jgi:thiosulfate/3-mercaptopyruvate sulfurtransferase
MCRSIFLSGISMKRVSQLTALALLIGLAASTSFAAETMPTLTLSTLQQQHGVAIDTA